MFLYAGKKVDLNNKVEASLRLNFVPLDRGARENNGDGNDSNNKKYTNAHPPVRAEIR